jgi:hypothetical protein
MDKECKRQLQHHGIRMAKNPHNKNGHYDKNLKQVRRSNQQKLATQKRSNEM